MDFEFTQAVIRQKLNDYFNETIKALGKDDFPAFEKASRKLIAIREHESRLNELQVGIKSLTREAEDIAEQIDKI